MKSILFVHQSADLYGSDKVVLNLADRLRAYGCRSVVMLPCDGPLVKKLSEVGVEVLILPVGKIARSTLSPRGLLVLARELWRLYRVSGDLQKHNHFDLIYSNTIATLGGAFLAGIWRKPHAWHVHEIIQMPKLAAMIFPRLVNWGADTVISNSKETARWLESVVSSIKTKNIVIWNGIENAGSIATFNNNYRKKWGVSDEEIVIALVGRINRWKGQWLLLDAVERLNKDFHSSFKLVYVGDAPPGQPEIVNELHERVRASSVCDNIIFQSFVNDIDSLWASVDIAVVPSVEPEPFGLVAIEAMRAERPVIAAAHGGLLEIIVDGKTGILFPPSNVDALTEALKVLIQNVALRERYGKAGRVRQEHLFSLDSQVERTAKCLKLEIS